MAALKFTEVNINLQEIKSNSVTFDNQKKKMTAHQLQPDLWIDLYADYLFNYAVARVSNAEIAKDLVQETFFAGLKSAKNYKILSIHERSPPGDSSNNLMLNWMD